MHVFISLLCSQWTKKVMSKVTKQNMQDVFKLREKKNVLLAVVVLSLYCRKGNITDVMLMGP